MFAKKTGLASISEGRSDLFRVDPKLLQIRDGWNCRDINAQDTQQHIEMLAQSIGEIGVQEPLTVYWEDGKAIVTDGHCRLLATLKAIENGIEVKTVPVKSEQRYTNEADRLFSQIIRNAGKPFSQMEQAKVFKRLLDMGWQQQDIAKKAGVSAARISQILDLLTMPEPIKQMVTNGQVSASMAAKVVAEHNPAKAVEIIQDAIAVAESEGRDRAMPKDVPVQKPVVVAPTRVQTLEKAVREAFDASTVDWVEDDAGLVSIAMPEAHWLIIRDMLKL